MYNENTQRAREHARVCESRVIYKIVYKHKSLVILNLMHISLD